MDNYKLAIIHDMDNSTINRQIEYIGDNLEEELHSGCLLQYAKENHGDIKIFQQLSIRHRPEVIGCLFIKYFNDIIFFNTTKNVSKHGYTGMFLLPNNISDEHMEALYEFADSIEKYNVSLSCSLKIEDGMVIGDEIYALNNETPRQLIDIYFNNEKNKKK